MISRARTKAIQGLVAATLALCSYLPDADASVAESPDLFVEALLAEVERVELDRAELELPDRQSLLHRLAQSPIPSIRLRVAQAAGALASEDPSAGLALLHQLARDPQRAVRSAAARALASFFEHAPGALRCAVESDWATARTAHERVTLARALAASAPDWMTDLTLLELASDPRPSVRRAALHAVRAQLCRNPDAYVSLAAARSADPDRRVRKSARRALRSEQARALSPAYQPSPAAVRESRKRFRRALRASTHAGAPAHARGYGVGVVDGAAGGVLLLG